MPKITLPGIQSPGGTAVGGIQTGSVAFALDKTGQMLGKFAMEMAEEEEQSRITKGISSGIAEMNELEFSMRANNVDPVERIGIYERKSQEVIQKSLAGVRTKRGRATVLAQLNGQQITQRNRLRAQGLAEFKAGGLVDLDLYLRQTQNEIVRAQDPEQRSRLFALGLDRIDSTQLLSPSERRQRALDFAQDRDEAIAFDLLIDNPREFLAALAQNQFPLADEQRLLSMSRQAMNAVDRETTRAENAAADRMDDSQDAFGNRAVLAAERARDAGEVMDIAELGLGGEFEGMTLDDMADRMKPKAFESLVNAVTGSRDEGVEGRIAAENIVNDPHMTPTEKQEALASLTAGVGPEYIKKTTADIYLSQIDDAAYKAGIETIDSLSPNADIISTALKVPWESVLARSHQEAKDKFTLWRADNPGATVSQAREQARILTIQSMDGAPRGQMRSILNQNPPYGMRPPEEAMYRGREEEFNNWMEQRVIEATLPPEQRDPNVAGVMGLPMLTEEQAIEELSNVRVWQEFIRSEERRREELGNNGR